MGTTEKPSGSSKPQKAQSNSKQPIMEGILILSDYKNDTIQIKFNYYMNWLNHSH